MYVTRYLWLNLHFTYIYIKIIGYKNRWYHRYKSFLLSDSVNSSIIMTPTLKNNVIIFSLCSKLKQTPHQLPWPLPIGSSQIETVSEFFKSSIAKVVLSSMVWSLLWKQQRSLLKWAWENQICILEGSWWGTLTHSGASVNWFNHFGKQFGKMY